MTKIIHRKGRKERKVFRIYVKDIMFLTITVPFWCAEYYLTGNIYVVDQDGVSGYHNRNPGCDLTMRDHRLEQIRADDVRDGLRSAVRDLPDAPCYVVLCLDAEDLDKCYARLEMGFAVGNMLLQGSALVFDGVNQHRTGTYTKNNRNGKNVVCLF